MTTRSRERWLVASALAIVAVVHASLLLKNTPTTDRYDELASAFLRGQTYRVEPSAAELLAP